MMLKLVRFSTQASRLRQRVSDQGLDVIGDEEFAYYTDPFTPGLPRRNEVLVEVSRD